MTNNLLKNAISICALITLITMLIIAANIAYDDVQSTSDYNTEKDKVTAGKIIDKKTENGYSTLLRGYIPQRYYLIVQWNYDNNGEITIEEKPFEVERDVYLAYEIGEDYDSKNFRYISEPKLTEETTMN